VSRTEKLAQTTAFVTIALIAAVWVAFPNLDSSLLLFGSTVKIHLDSVWQFGLVAIALGLVGTQSVVASKDCSFDRCATFWALPCGVIASGVFLIDTVLLPQGDIFIALLTALGYVIVVTYQTRALRQHSSAWYAVRQGLSLTAYAVAGLLFFGVARYQPGLFLTLLGVSAISLGMASEIFRNAGVPIRELWFYSALAALVVCELELAISFVALPPRLNAAVLFLIFYSTTGLAQQSLLGRLNRRVLGEYALLCTGGLLFLYLIFR